ncbi:Oxoglutarate dehydrogenase [Globisporangium polare]
MLRLQGSVARVVRDAARRSTTSRSCSSPLLSLQRAAFASSSSTSAPTLESLALRSMVSAFRQYGHLEADLDPLQLQKKQRVQDLMPSNFQALFDCDAAAANTGEFTVPAGAVNGKQLYDHLQQTYCGKMGFEFQHVSSPEEKAWLAQAVESLDQKFPVLPSDLRNAYTSMLSADVFETFMAKKFSSFKRYSGEGAEAMLPAVHTVLNAAAVAGISDVVIGMPHRGRLALLVSLLEYPAHKLFYKVQGNSEFPKEFHGVDDVTSHIAQSVDKSFGDKKVHVSLLHNPSHLEIINPVTTGKVRAKIDAGSNAMAFMLHGDAAFSGQGCVPEGLSLSQLPGFKTGGSVHLIVNNQVGFTTTFKDGRSTRYSSDIAKGIEAPVIHVNGESVHHVIQAARLAVEYRNRFKKDIVIDMIGYRRHGHNEVDEPRFTQPKMYEAVGEAGRFPIKFSKELQTTGLVTEEGVQKLVDRLNAHLEKELQIASDGYTPTEIDAFKGKWSSIGQPQAEDLYVNESTGLSLDKLLDVGLESVNLPPHIQAHDRLQRTHVESRKKMLTKSAPEGVRVDWATAEAMAFGSLLREGNSVRLAGQDCRRGTFSQRHAAFTDQATEELYFPFHHLPESQGKFTVINSNLSELAVMAFEYGYSWEDPKNLVIWEAQFGDFFNGAQIVIDQFLACAESKWMRQSGLVLLLPHGYDGAGPDHSSGRIERFLQLVDTPALTPSYASKKQVDWKDYQHDTNIIVVNPTTPANYFHMLRRQQQRSFRKPVVVMAPKTLLRLADATSSLQDLGPATQFQPVFGDASISEPSEVKKVYFCSGKFYYDLVKERASRSENPSEIAIIRLEELAPFPFQQVAEEMAKFENVKKVVYVQEEPLNQGAWTYAKAHLEKVVSKKLPIDFIGRESLAACAVGLSKRNKAQVQEIFTEAFGPARD